MADRSIVGALALVIAIAIGVPTRAATSERIDLPVRGQSIALTIYRPVVAPAKIKGTVLMGSGDVGWVGLAASLADSLSSDGYLVAGINVRQYLAAYTTGKGHLQTFQVPADYSEIAAYLRSQGLLVPPVVVSGVSEGAALAVLAASEQKNHGWISGVITMGLPSSAELAWRWSDFTSWLTKKDSIEPSFAPRDFIANVSPLPIYMIQSTKDEYVAERQYRALEAAAQPPKRLILIDASNHRFTDRRDELRRQVWLGLAWIRGLS